MPELTVAEQSMKESFTEKWAREAAEDFYNKNPDAIDNITSVTKDLSEKDVNGFFDDKATPVNKAKDPLDKAKEDRDKKYKSRRRMARHIMVAGLVAGTLFIPAVGPMVAGMMSSFYMSYVRDEKKKELRGLTHDPVTKKYTAKETALKTVGFLAERGAEIALSAIAGPIIPVVSLLAEKLVPLLSGLGVEVAMEKFMGKFKRKKPDAEKPKDADKEPQAGKRKVGFFGRLLGRAKKPNQINEKDLTQYVQNVIDTQQQVNIQADITEKPEFTEQFSKSENTSDSKDRSAIETHVTTVENEEKTTETHEAIAKNMPTAKSEATATVAHAANNNHKWEDMVASHNHGNAISHPRESKIASSNDSHKWEHMVESHDHGNTAISHPQEPKKPTARMQEPKKDWEKFVKEHSSKGESDSDDHGV